MKAFRKQKSGYSLSLVYISEAWRRKFWKSLICTTFGQYSTVFSFYADTSKWKFHWSKTWLRIAYTTLCSCSKDYKVKKKHTWNAINCNFEIKNILREWDTYIVCNKVIINDREHHWKIRKLKELANLLCWNNLISRSSIDINKIWEPPI